jgi:hypothetical protein
MTLAPIAAHRRHVANTCMQATTTNAPSRAAACHSCQCALSSSGARVSSQSCGSSRRLRPRPRRLRWRRRRRRKRRQTLWASSLAISSVQPSFQADSQMSSCSCAAAVWVIGYSCCHLAARGILSPGSVAAYQVVQVLV